MGETPMGSAAGNPSQQEVARLADAFRRSFAALDADARAAGQRWAGQIHHELAGIGPLDLRADVSRALSDIASVDREMSRDRTLHIGTALHPAVGPASDPLAAPETGMDASEAVSGIGAAAGGVLAAVRALGGTAAELRDSARKLGVSGASSAPAVMVSMGQVASAQDRPESGLTGTSVAAGSSEGAIAAAPAIAGLGRLADALSQMAGGSASGAVTAPPSQAAASGLLGFPTTGVANGRSQMPALGMTGSAAGGGPATGSGSASSPSEAAPMGTGAHGMADAVNDIMGLVRSLPGRGPAGLLSDFLAPNSRAGTDSVAGNPIGAGSGLDAEASGILMHGVHPAAAVPPGSNPTRSLLDALGSGIPGGAVLNPDTVGGRGPLTDASGGAGTNGGSSASGVVPVGNGRWGNVGAGQDADPGAETIQSGPLELFGFNSPAADYMASAPTGTAQMSPMANAGPGNPLALLTSLFPGAAGGVTNNQSNATFNINGGGNQPGMDLFMSFWREFGRIGGLAGAVGSFLQ